MNTSINDKEGIHSENQEMGINICVNNVNVVMVGGSRTGKTRFIKSIEYIDNLGRIKPDPINIFRGTKVPEMYRYAVSIENKTYTLNILDTPGFDEIVATDEIKRNNGEIAHIIAENIKTNFATLNLVCITINGSSGLNTNHVQNIENILRILGGMFIGHICIMVTHAEKMTPNNETEWINQFNNIPQLKTIRIMCKGNILFTGSITGDLPDLQREIASIREVERIKKFINMAIQKKISYTINKAK